MLNKIVFELGEMSIFYTGQICGLAIRNRTDTHC